MDIKTLIEAETLEQNDLPGRDLLLRIGDRVETKNLARHFNRYSGKFADQIACDADHIRFKLLSSLTARVFAETGETNVSNSTRMNFRRRVSGTGNRKLKEVAAIGRFAGVVEEDGAVYIVDACGGVGILSTGISFLRGESKGTVADCVDISEERSKRHDLLRRSLGGGNPNLRLKVMDVRDFVPEIVQGRTNYCLAKHPCGHAVDIVIGKLLETDEGQFPHTTLMTCCHGGANTHFPFKYVARKDKVFLDETDWLALTGMTNWVDGQYLGHDGGQVTQAHQLVGRVAMRLIDLQRAVVLPENLNPRVQELLPPEISSRNHGIIVNCA